MHRNSSDASDQAKELIHAQASMLENVGQGGPLDRAVGWHRELECLLGEVLLESDVTASLADNHPAVAPESSDHFSVVD